MSSALTSWPMRMASRATVSDTSEAAASTITTASRLPATTRSSWPSSSWAKVGFTMNSPSM